MINLAIIPARSGSKRLKNKNIINFAGKQMIYWPIKELQKIKLFDNIYVSTDSLVIKKISEKLGVKVPFLRPKKISNDHASTIDVVKHFTKYLDKNKIPYDNICCVYPTSVFIKSKIIIQAYKKLLLNKNQFVFCAQKIDKRIQRSFYFNKATKKINFLFPDQIKSRTQDLQNAYIDAAQFYWGTKNNWIKKKNILSNNSSFIEIDSNLVNDIDNLEDYKKALFKFKKFYLKN